MLHTLIGSSMFWYIRQFCLRQPWSSARTNSPHIRTGRLETQSIQHRQVRASHLRERCVSPAKVRNTIFFDWVRHALIVLRESNKCIRAHNCRPITTRRPATQTIWHRKIRTSCVKKSRGLLAKVKSDNRRSPWLSYPCSNYSQNAPTRFFQL